MAKAAQSALWIERLTVQHHRNLVTQSLHCHPRFNLITGQNGSGKTALLEAIYLLSRGRSFRSPKAAPVIQRGQSALLIQANGWRLGEQWAAGLWREVSDYRLHYDETPCAQSALAQRLPVQLMNHDRLNLALDSPEARRKLLDYGVFYQNPDFLHHHHAYHHALKQANAALRAKWSREHLTVIYQHLAHHGERLAAMRQQYLHQLQSALHHYHHQLGGFGAVDLRYVQGFGEMGLLDCLQRNYERDVRQGYVKDGSHRADFAFYEHGQNIAHFYSRGEQKTLIGALLLAQAQLIHEQWGVAPLMLIDDLGAELDLERQSAWLGLLVASGAQCFITHLQSLEFNHDYQQFNLENGQIIAR